MTKEELAREWCELVEGEGYPADIKCVLPYAELLLELREALEELRSVQNGCPLPKYEDDWNAAMGMTSAVLAKAEALLKEEK